MSWPHISKHKVFFTTIHQSHRIHQNVTVTMSTGWNLTLLQTVYKISGHPGILTPKIAGGCSDFSTWLSTGLPCFTPVCTSIYGTDAQRFWRTTRFNGMGIRQIVMFFPLIYTLVTNHGSIGLQHLPHRREPGGRYFTPGSTVLAPRVSTSTVHCSTRNLFFVCKQGKTGS